MKIVCLPYAGGSSHSYDPLIRVAKGKLEFVPIELPGRGERGQEPLLKDLSEMANDIFNQLKEKLQEPYIVYGHSMGAILALLFARLLIQKSFPMPKCLVVSGSKAPVIKNKEKRHQLPKEKFIEEILRLGGMSESVLLDNDIFGFLEPILRADIEANDSYVHLSGVQLDIPINVAISKDDDISIEAAEGWSSETSEPATVAIFPGNHFFIFQHPEKFVEFLIACTNKVTI